MVAHGGRPGTRPSSLSKPAGSSPGLPPPELWDPLPNISPPPTSASSLCGVAGGDPCKGLCSAPRGHPGAGCERHPEAFHGDPVFPGAPFGGDTRNLLGGGCDAFEPNAHLPTQRKAGLRPVGGWATRSVPAGAWPCAHHRSSHVRERAARARGTPASPSPPASRSRRTRVGCFQPHPHGRPHRGRLKSNETHHRGARSWAHSHALVCALAPLPSRPLRYVRGGGHSLLSMQGSPGSGSRRGRWSGLQGTVSLGQPLAPSPAEQSPLFQEGLRTWGHRRWPWGSMRAVLAPAGLSVFLKLMPSGVDGAVSSERTLNVLFAPAPAQAAGLHPPACCFAPSAGPAPALSLCPPRAPRRALHAFGLGKPPLCGLTFHQT